MRENIGCFVDACAELGVAQRELFVTADLFENKNWKVTRNRHTRNGHIPNCHEYNYPSHPTLHLPSPPPQAVLKSIHGLARLAHFDIPGFFGPHMGIRKKGRCVLPLLPSYLCCCLPVSACSL